MTSKQIDKLNNLGKKQITNFSSMNKSDKNFLTNPVRWLKF